MKKTIAFILTAFICCTTFAACSISSAEDQKSPLTVYSFSGENEQFAISNGVIVLDSTKEIFYGGDLEEKQESFSDITAFTTTFYIASGNEKKTLLSNSVVDMTDRTLTVPGDIGKISGDIITDSEIADLPNNLYFELETTDLNGVENVYQLQLTLTEITANAND